MTLVTPGNGVVVLDLIYLAVVIALIALVALAARAVQKL